jgi:hypothetical protein
MKTLLIITPHMSTGGCPQVVAKKVEVLRIFYNIVVVEWECIAWLFVVQRNRVINMIGDKFISLSENKEYDLFNVISDYDPDYIMIEEFSETFIPNHILKRLYSKDRNYKIFETTHSSHTQPNWKRFLPDKFIFVSPHSLEVFKDMGVPMDLIEYPIDGKTPNKEYYQNLLGLDPEYKHVINVGLFTHGKNQGYVFEVARLLQDYKIKFHFLGNQAGNFIDYWKPIMETKPENCIVWGERNDIDSWIQSCDVHFFSSRLELNPLSIKESLEYGKPTMIFNLGTYKGKYDNVKNAHFLSGDLIKDSENLLKILDINTMDRLSSPPNSPKIRVVHLLLDPNESEDLPPEKWKSNIDRQNFSIECWSRMKDKFFDYIPRYTRVNRSELPSENCMDPEIINHSKDLEIKFPALSYGHYGAYKAHTEGILENFSDDIDALIIAEGDSYTDLAPEDFYNKILESYKLAQQIDARLVSYAGPVYMTGGEWWNMSKDHGDWIQVPHFLLGTTYMIMRSERSGMINNILSTKWHSPDLWIAWNYHCKSTLLVSRNPLVKQKEGYSVLDYTNKW